ncbi:hypothetical protein JCM10207_007840 [Rhodosporidiobolus poonsookiae]
MLSLRPLLRSLRTPFPVPARLASTAPSSTASKPKKQVDTAPPAPDTKGQLGQVEMPDMAAIEEEMEVRASIPSAPDAFHSSFSPSSSSTDETPAEPAAQVITASHPSTYPSGGPSLNSQGDDVQPGQSGDSTTPLPRESDRSGEGSSREGGSQSKAGEPLTADEARGAWALAGILVGGWVVGTVTDPGWRSASRKAKAH